MVDPLGDSKRRILDHLKRVPSAVTGELADHLGVSEAAVRLHLADLEDRGLVEHTVGGPDGRGRPPKHWSLSPVAIDLFPDRHADLTVDLIGAVRAALGDEGLDRVLSAREAGQLAALRETIPPAGTATLRDRVGALAARRTSEGYMAEIGDDGDGGLLLVEHHCPVCAAATECQGLCRSELDLFRAALGDDVDVERTQHLLSGDERCVYRIRTRVPRPDSKG